MGKTSRWLKSLLGFKRDKQTPKNQNDNVKDKRRWSFTQSRDSASAPTFRRYSLNIPVAGDSFWLQDHTDAVAVAAAADAALAAAQAAMAVIRLTTVGRSRARFAALKIQTVFRGFLARKALRALKGVVKLQAHVRGFLVRKRAAATLHCMQAMVRAQAAARWHNEARRSIAHDVSPNLSSNTQSRMSLGKIQEKYEETRSEFHSKRVSSTTYTEDSYEDTPKTVEIDTYNAKSRTPSHRPNYYYYAASEYDVDDDMNPMPMSGPLVYPVMTPSRLNDLRQRRTSTAHSTPRFANNMSVSGDSSFRSQRLSGSYQRNYMASTQSFEAKSRSQSAPKQRPPHPSPSKKRMECLYGISGTRMHRSFSEDTEHLHF